MKRRLAPFLSVLVLVLGASAGSSYARETAASELASGAPTVAAESGFDTLMGRWVRPDGGYLITIQGVDADGRLDAAYRNPNPLPFAKAQASRIGNAIKVFLELRAGGYNGSTYSLSYDPANDVLHGVYYQAAAQQQYDVYFERAEPR
ncbi:hypothetical protein [Thiocapsa marina]|uniref:Uncharacterized protein n=1 Tax=Thiocapsa marina 5811 TaxID=768671 RepID=F9UB67_9GAMM|nr:hypothetical protein [Thiocapsa marina]EGV18685.1 hypothetical protein ThimaDRAFT_2103 [Thiocapsa marina 5811]